MPASEWNITPFNKELHDRSNFDCNVASLNDWLKTKASQYEKRDLARAYVLLEKEGSAVKGYYAISNHSLAYIALPDDQKKGLPSIDVPVILLGRLAVDSSVQGQGLGELLLLDALRRAEFVSTKIGVQAVEVEAINETAKNFYEKYGFLALLDDPRHLYLPMKVIRKLKLPPL